MRFPTVAHLAHALEPYATRRGRVSIEQILATLNVTLSDDGLGATMRADMPPMMTPRQTAPLATPRQTSALRQTTPLGLPPAPELGPTLIEQLQSPRDARQTGPHFTVSAPAAAPPNFVTAPAVTARKSGSHLPTVVIALLLLGICGVAWRALRTPPEPAPRARPRRATQAPSPTATRTADGHARGRRSRRPPTPSRRAHRAIRSAPQGRAGIPPAAARADVAHGDDDHDHRARHRHRTRPTFPAARRRERRERAYFFCGWTMISTRRLFARPSADLLSAMGRSGPMPTDGDAVGGDAARDELRLHGVGALLAEVHVVLALALRVGVTLDGDVRVGVALDERVGDLVQLETAAGSSVDSLLAKSTPPDSVMTIPRDSCLTLARRWRSAIASAAAFSAASRAAFSRASWSCVFSRLLFVELS